MNGERNGNGWRRWITSVGIPLAVWVGSLLWMLSSFASFTRETTNAMEKIDKSIQGLTVAVDGLKLSQTRTDERIQQLAREHSIQWRD